MRLQPLFAVPLALFIAAAVGTAGDDAAKKELAKLQGNWTIVSMKLDGKETEKSEHSHAHVEGNKFATKLGEKVVRAGSMKLDLAQNPKTIDTVYTVGPDQGKTIKGIYQLDGDNWKLCFSAPGKDRPKDFPEKSEVAHILLILKRDK